MSADSATGRRLTPVLYSSKKSHLMEERVGAAGEESNGDAFPEGGERDGIDGGSSSPKSESFPGERTTAELKATVADPGGDEFPRISSEMEESIMENTNGKQATEESYLEEKRKPTERRSQYHSIQQLSLPSKKSGGSSALSRPNISYKISDLVDGTEYLEEGRLHPSPVNGCKNLENTPEDDDGKVVERLSRSALLREPGISHWKGFDAQKAVILENFSDEDEEFFRSSARASSMDELSDLEMSDGSGSMTGSSGERKGQVSEDSNPEQEAGYECVAMDVGREIGMEAKRARVENIIKTMTPSHQSHVHSFPISRSFPVPSSVSIQLSGAMEKCDLGFRDQSTETRRPKRKQYIPQQVDPRGDRNDLPPAAKICIMERDAVRRKCRLQEMQGHDVEMQQLLFNRDQFSDEDEDDASRKALNHNTSDFNQNDIKVRELHQKFFSDAGGAEDRRFNGPSTGLEQLAKILKEEIAGGVERLVDNFINTIMMKNLAQSISGDVVKETETMVPGKGNHYGDKDVELLVSPGRRIKTDPSRMDSHPKEEMIQRQLSESKDESAVQVSESSPEQVSLLRSVSTTPPQKEPSYQLASRSDSDVGCRLPSLPPPPLPFQVPFTVHGSTTDGINHHYDREKQPLSDKYFFDAHNGSTFGLPRPPLPLFGPHHPPLYYPSCIGKFPPGFVKDQEQLEPLPLIVGAHQKKPKRTKVIDRVSPRAIRSMPSETATQCDDEPPYRQTDSPVKSSFNHSTHFHPSGTVHDAFPHPSMLPFGLAPSVALHSPGLRQHSKFIQAMYCQMSSIGHRDHPSRSLPSPTQKTPLYRATSDSKSFQKCDSMEYEPLVVSSDAMLTAPSNSFTSTLTPMHLRKAKLMFFYVRYPSSSILKVYFPDVKFNKNNTAQLVKWFSNFREFYYIQMEKYARQALAEGVKSPKDLVITTDAELYRVLVVHYNRNCQIEVPENFRFVVQSTLREFYTSIVADKDQEPSWKKAIYKVIQRMDDPVPDYFKNPNWMERLSDG